MTRVLVDGQITGADGIGRYTACLTAALREAGGEALDVVAVPSAAPRYGPAEGAGLLAAVARNRAGLLHLPDYRVPLAPVPVPLVATVHDLLRLRSPDLCYPDDVFAGLHGADAFAGLAASVRELRSLAEWPPGATRLPRSLHEEFCGRMLRLAADRADRLIVPTHVVAGHLAEALGSAAPHVVVAPYGVDHLRPPRIPRPLPAALRPGGYLLHVGQNRPHKGLSTVLRGYAGSAAPGRDVPLVLVGRDFPPGFVPPAGFTGTGVVALGQVDDATLFNLYEGAAALLHMSDHEGFGFTPLEAMTAGCPVVVSDLPVLRETLGPHARFVAPGDAGGLVHAVDSLLAGGDGGPDPEPRKRWASAYRWDRHARRLLSCYAELT